MTRVNDEVRRAVRARSRGRCEARMRSCAGEPTVFHQRQPDAQSSSGVLFICKTCSDEIAAKHMKALMMGFIVPSWMDPGDIPVRRGDWGR